MRSRTAQGMVVCLVAGAVALAWGCIAGVVPAPDAGSADAGGAGGDAGAAGDGGCAPVPEVALSGGASAGTIDDLSGQQSKTGGSWYSYSSRTLPNSEPTIPMTDAGTLDPIEGAPFPPNNGANGPTSGTGCVPPLAFDGAALGYRVLRGSGIPAWGAGFGLDLQSQPPDGGPVAIDACDAGAIFDNSPDASGVGIPQPFDASAYGGFTFWGISLVGDVSVEVHVDDADTTPWGGVFCDPCRSSGSCTGSKAAGDLDCPCSDNFFLPVKFLHGQWTQFAVRWDNPNFTANHWSHEGPLVFDPTRIYNIHFQDTISSGSTPAFAIAVADLEWLAK